MNVQRIAKILEEKNDLKVRGVILDTAQRKNQIIHGSRAFNIQSPVYLRKETKDWDVLTKKPKKYAEQVAERLSRILGKKVDVIRGKHKGTYKVRINEETIADYTQLKHKPKTVSSWGNKIRTLKSIKQNTQRLVKNPKKEFRRGKDIDTLDRIRQIEEMNKRFSL